VSFLQLQTLFPVPAGAVQDALGECSRVVVVDENLGGLYAGVLEPQLGGRALMRVNAVGSMIPPARIERAVEDGE
jgi:pyruvate/2-oxoacid:ferredoxin oxidoreductase alpha subunit